MRGRARWLAVVAWGALGLTACDRLPFGLDAVEKKATSEQAAGAGTTEPSEPASSATVAAKRPDLPPEQLAVSGVWQGTFSSSRFAGDVVGLVTETGDGRFVSSAGAQLVGHFDAAGETVTARCRVYQGNQLPADYDIEGKVAAKKSLQGSYQSPRDSGTFDLSYNADYERQPSLEAVAHQWGSTTYAMKVDEQGKFAGKDSGGCQYEGTLAIVDPRFNAYEVEFSIKRCLYRGSYVGLALVTDASFAGDLMLYAASGGKYARGGYLMRGGTLGTNVTAAARRATVKAREAHRKGGPAPP